MPRLLTTGLGAGGRTGRCRGLPRRVGFPLLALCISRFVISPWRALEPRPGKEGKNFFFFSTLLQPPNATSAASCRMTSMRNGSSPGLLTPPCPRGHRDLEGGNGAEAGWAAPRAPHWGCGHPEPKQQQLLGQELAQGGFFSHHFQPDGSAQQRFPRAVIRW